MAEQDLDALAVRAPDNVLYLTNFWGMKGYDACVFPREGEPVLICLEASEEEAASTAWTSDVRLFRGYDERDPRPPTSRVLELAKEAAREYDRIGLELSLGTQAADRMVGEPTTFTAAWFTEFGDAVGERLYHRTRPGGGSPCASSQETTGFRSTPIFSISASITSPGFR